jgi:hypothetical protein
MRDRRDTSGRIPAVQPLVIPYYPYYLQLELYIVNIVKKKKVMAESKD